MVMFIDRVIHPIREAQGSAAPFSKRMTNRDSVCDNPKPYRCGIPRTSLNVTKDSNHLYDCWDSLNPFTSLRDSDSSLIQ